MSKTYLQPGHVIDITANGSDITNGSVVVVGSIVAVALVDIPDGETGSGSVEGVHTLPKATGSGISQGAKVYWNDTNGEMTTSSSGNTLAGYAFEARESADAEIPVKLNAAS